jgi:glycosyltransferase involved in cell wall biosynthesis
MTVTNQGKRSVLLVGTSTETKGGIGYVVADYLSSDLNHKYNLIHIVTHRDGSRSRKMLMFLSSLLQFTKYLLCHPHTIVHIHTSSGPSFLRKLVFIVLAKLFRSPTILHIHTGGLESYYLSGTGLLRSMICYAFRHVDLIIVLSPAWHDVVHRLCDGHAPIHICQNPVDTHKYRPGKLNRRSSIKNLVFLGSIIKEKGVYDLIHGIHGLLRLGISVSATIAGDREVEKARRLAKELQLNNHITFPGWICETRKIALLQNCDLFVLPSYREGMPRSLLEAMACGVPVVVSNVGGIPDVVEHGVNGLLFQPGDVMMLIRYMALLLSDDDLSDRMSGNNVEKIRAKYSLSSVMSELDSAYSRFL